MRRIDELHPFAGARMLRDLLRQDGYAVGRHWTRPAGLRSARYRCVRCLYGSGAGSGFRRRIQGLHACALAIVRTRRSICGLIAIRGQVSGSSEQSEHPRFADQQKGAPARPYLARRTSVTPQIKQVIPKTKNPLR